MNVKKFDDFFGAPVEQEPKAGEGGDILGKKVKYVTTKLSAGILGGLGAGGSLKKSNIMVDKTTDKKEKFVP